MTPYYTATLCWTQSMTPTSCFTPTATNPASVSGSLTYTGTGTVDGSHPMFATYANLTSFVISSGGAYSLRGGSPATYNIYAFFDFNGIGNSLGVNYLNPFPGERYAHVGACSNPASPSSYSTGIVLGANVGPNITLDDSCSFWGVFGTVSYTGIKGTVQVCRRINIQTYSDAGYTAPAPYTLQFFQNSHFYYFVTNTGAGATGLTPLYVRVWFDVNGNNIFDTGDPYLELGPVTPTTDGLLQNINFGDAFIK